MPATLPEILLAPQAKPQVVDDCQALIDHQVSEMSGISGTAIKLAYKTVNKFAADHVHHQVEALLPLMAGKLDPYWADFHTAGGADFGDYLSKRGDEVSEALLSITDARAANSTHPTIVKAYQAVRGNAAKHVVAALPQVGALVQKYA
ncbi:MAG TPA: hypothetical protein VIZ20_11835 [Streptosporangiaceae bacterium]